MEVVSFLQFADEAANKLEQDLLILQHGTPTYRVKERARRYQDYFNNPLLRNTPIVLKYMDQVQSACSAQRGVPAFVSGVEIAGDALRTFQKTPVLTGPLVCQLCDADFTNEADFGKHVSNEHCSMDEYRKRVIYLMELRGHQELTAQERRLIVQNFSHFQQFSRPGTGTNAFEDAVDVPRCEAACAMCQQKDFIEH